MKGLGKVISVRKELIEINGKKFEYIIEYKKTRILKFKIFPDLTIKIISPKTIGLMEIRKRLAEKKDWLLQGIEFYRNKATIKENLAKDFTSVYFLGKKFKLDIILSKQNKIGFNKKSILVNAKENNEAQISILVDKLYYYYAVSYFSKLMIKCLKHLKKFNIPTPSLHIRKMKSRWGSCIPKKNKITINLHLIKFPPRCIEYVIMHELCHLKYANHSKQYYTFLSEVMPDWKIRKKTLNDLYK